MCAKNVCLSFCCEYFCTNLLAMKHETNKYNSVVCRRNILSLSRFRNLCKTNEKVVSVCSDDEEGGGRKSKMGVVY